MLKSGRDPTKTRYEQADICQNKRHSINPKDQKVRKITF